MMASNRWRSIIALCSIFFLVATGCADTTPSSEEGDDGEQGTSADLLMVPNGGTDIAGEVTRSVELKVFLYDQQSGAPIDNEAVDFGIEDADDDDDHLPSLDASTVYTGSDGAAAIDVTLSNVEDQWTVRADNPRANPVDFTVTAGPTESGQLDVMLTNATPSIMGLSDVDVRVYPSANFECEYFAPLATQDEDTVAEEFSPFADQSVSFDNLSVANTYVVTAVARGEQGQVAAGGCMDSVVIQHNETTSAEVMLQLVPLNPVGTYDVTSNWDFTEAVADSGPAGSIIVRVLDIFEDPGVAIYDEIINLIGNLVGGLISETFDTFLGLTGLDTQFQTMINDFIDGSSGLSQVRDAGQDLRDVVADLEVTSELSIGKLSRDFEFRGQDNWLGITLYWTWDCDANAEPDCGAIELNADGDGEFAELGILSSDWDGQIAAYDQLQIEEHTVSLRYGRLISYVLNDVMLPAVTDGNASSMSDAFAYWFGCDTIAGWLGSDDSDCVGGSAVEDIYCLETDTIEDFCETAVSSVFGFADILIDTLEYDMGLRLGGQGTLIEETSDGFVDRIEDGVFEGYIEDSDDGGTTSTFDATWEAERDSDDAF